ncbi:hypothetical protein [Cryobacterium sp. GrIS_2_6]|uniref:hypothetical protein n=1 Tax=Cryobacterium sp. GrIS_2_6 TaxID=3162785 RepID=UPI002E0828A6|nr:hypothetical protein [Cryobacterium psychrotolerans]
MSPPASALYVPTYASRSPYLTPAEYLASPTGVNVSQLVVGGTPQQNADALSQTIARASSLADDYCYQILGATLDTQAGRYRVSNEGTLKVPLAFTPVIQVTNVSVGPQPSMMASLPDLSNVWVGRKVTEIPILAMSFPMPGATSRTASGYLYAAVTYVNGYANSVLTAATNGGATTILVDSTLGVLPGMQLTIHEPGVSERVNVLSVTGNTATLAAPLVNLHSAGANVSALPEAIKQAVVLLTSALIKTRGSEALVMSSMRGQPAKTAKVEDGGLEEIDLAVEWLSRHRRTQ